jgi:hypothetical protein
MKRAMSENLTHLRLIRRLADGEFHLATKKQIFIK